MEAHFVRLPLEGSRVEVAHGLGRQQPYAELNEVAPGPVTGQVCHPLSRGGGQRVLRVRRHSRDRAEETGDEDGELGGVVVDGGCEDLQERVGIGVFHKPSHQVLRPGERARTLTSRSDFRCRKGGQGMLPPTERKAGSALECPRQSRWVGLLPGLKTACEARDKDAAGVQNNGRG